MKQSQENPTTDFIHQPEFIEWVLRPNDQLNLHWKEFLENNPSEIGKINLAKKLITGIIPDEKPLTEEEVLSLWNKIEESTISRRRRSLWLNKWAVAAGILLIIGLSGWFLYNHSLIKSEETNYYSETLKIKPGKEIKLILADNTEKLFPSNEITLKYNEKGKLESDSVKRIAEEVTVPIPDKEQMNQLVVPFGKKSKVELADGTKLWLNSGSRAIYPVLFKKDKREIFIEGEGYLEVAHDAKRPFFVVTNQMRVRVLGTKFNVSAYEEDATVSVALVEGSVEASTGTKKMVLMPNQLLTFQKSTSETTVSNANVLEFVSWIDGWMMCNQEKLTSILTKLSRYYDVRIDFSDPKLTSMTITGKLDLKTNYEDVLKVICATAPVKYETLDDKIILISND